MTDGLDALLEVASPPQTWRILSTPPWNGSTNMDFDRQTLEAVIAGSASPTLRFFRWEKPGVSFGRLQRREAIAPLIPSGWEAAQRPTGGGIVFHENDLCLSLCWRRNQAPMPERLSEVYAAIHRIILQALAPLQKLQMASCRDCASTATDFKTRQCFQEPAVFDLLNQGQKVLGGALCRRKNGFLYQGSLQASIASPLQPLLETEFCTFLNAPQ